MNKRYIALIISICLFFSLLVACKKDQNITSGSPNSTTKITDEIDSANNNQTGSTTEDEGEVIVSDTSPSVTASTTKRGGATTTAKPLEYETTKQDKMFEKARGSTILIFYGGTLSESEKKVAAEFTKQYGIKIKYEVMGWAEYNAKIAQRVQAGNPPDTAVMTDASALNFMYAGIAQPLNKYMDLNDKYWNKEGMKQFSIGSNYYGIPNKEISTFFIYYNKTLFQEQGAQDPYELYKAGKWNFAKLREIAKKMTLREKDNTTIRCYGIATWYREVFALANGGNIIAPDGKGGYTSVVDKPGALGGLNLLKDLCKDGSFNPTIPGYTEFKSRKVAMLVERPQNAIGQYDYYNTMKDKIGVVPVPKGPNADKVYAPSNMTANYIPKNAKNPLGGMAWNYFGLRRNIEGEKQNHPDEVAYRRKYMSEEHEKIIKDYLKNATIITSKLDSLSSWSNYSNEFWDGLVSKYKPAEEVAATMKGMLDSAIIRTIGK